MEPLPGDDSPHLPAPSLWPVGFAIGIACILVGLIVNPIVIIPIGVVIAVVFGALWVRDATRDYRGTVPDVEPERREVRPSAPAIPAQEGEAALPQMSDEEIDRFPRSRFLEGATLGLGGVIGGLVTVPALGFMVLPSFLHQGGEKVDLGPLENFPVGSWVIATFMTNPGEGEVSRRTAYIRNNGMAGGEPSLTIISNRCAHLGCPVQPNGPVFDTKKKTEKTSQGNEVTIIPMLPAGGFGCPCHGGQYDPEGNRTAGPPVRGLDRFQYSIVNGHLVLGKTFSVAHVDGAGAKAKIKAYPHAGPGQHVSGIEAWLYPWTK